MFAKVSLYSRFWEIEFESCIHPPPETISPPSKLNNTICSLEEETDFLMQTAQGGEWVMRWKVEFPFLLQTLQTATQILLPRVKKSAKASRNWINIDRRSDRKIEWRLRLGSQPSYELFASIMNVFRDQTYHDEVVAYIFQRLLQTILSKHSFDDNMYLHEEHDLNTCAVLIQ